MAGKVIGMAVGGAIAVGGVICSVFIKKNNAADPVAKKNREPYDGNGKRCGYCLKNVANGESVRMLKCNHWVHSACHQERKTCPTCKNTEPPVPFQRKI